nr:Uncharacterised protein [Streptococcus thermophilus]
MDIRNEFARRALQRCGDQQIAPAVVNDVVQILREGEEILEVALTSAPGFTTACVCTSSRLFLGTAPGQVTVIDHEWLTGFSGRPYGPSQEPTLTLKALDGEVNWIGFNQAGLLRILHALAFCFEPTYQATTIPELFNRWIDIHQESDRVDLADEQFDQRIHQAIGKRPWLT